MAAANKPKKPLLNLHSNLAITLFFIVVFTIPALLLLHTPSNYIASNLCSNDTPWSGDLRRAEFAWNKLRFDVESLPPETLKIAVFSRKWPTTTVPGGMERHAHTLHTALARRGHEVHVFTSPSADPTPRTTAAASPVVHCHEGDPDKWRYNKAWEQYEEENRKNPFDVVHSESVALLFFVARGVENLAVTSRSKSKDEMETEAGGIGEGREERRSEGLLCLLYEVKEEAIDLMTDEEVKYEDARGEFEVVDDKSG